MRRAPLVVLVVLAGAALVAAGRGLHRGSASVPPSPHCRSGDPLAGVYHPARLDLKSRCRVASGVVERVKYEDFDGDVHIELALDDGDRGLLARGNEAVGGNLIVEVIPQERSAVAIPALGEHVSVVGPWVNDTTHGWNEIHPAWWISSGQIVPASPEELRRVEALLESGGGDDEG